MVGIHWGDCKKRGKCFLKTAKPAIEILDPYMPPGISLSDLDGFTEINGWFLFMEWKTYKPEDKDNLRNLRTLCRLSCLPRCTAIMAVGESTTLSARLIRVFENVDLWQPDTWPQWELTNRESFCERVGRWAWSAHARPSHNDNVSRETVNANVPRGHPKPPA